MMYHLLCHAFFFLFLCSFFSFLISFFLLVFVFVFLESNFGFLKCPFIHNFLNKNIMYYFLFDLIEI